MQRAALVGKKVLLTHSGDGLGFVIAIAFAQAGAEVVIHDRSAAVVAAAVEHLSLAVPGSRVIGEHADLSTNGDARQILAYAGPIDILIIDAHAVGVVNFARLEEQDARQDRQALRVHAETLLDEFLLSIKGAGPCSIFMLSLAPIASEESSSSLISRPCGNAGGKGELTVNTLSVRDLILAPVADLMKSEVLRTNGTVAEVSEHLLHDHRPAAIEEGLTAIRQLTDEIIQACIDQLC
jgi:NAD(P)-dependent dehydrogenase (short-subunit alcohol dehydrogenase family)